MRNWEKHYPPYEGTEPYLYLAFAEEDAARVWGVLRPLLERGCRVWYCTGSAGGSEELLRRQERASGASLTLLYLSDAAVADMDTKSAVLVNQKFSRPILCLDPDGTDRRLSMGLRETVPHFPLYRYRDRAEMEAELIRAEGFRQELLGEPVRIAEEGIAGRVSLGLCLLAALLLALSFLGLRVFHWFRPEAEDGLGLTDRTVLSAALEAAGGPLTEESAQRITVLRLDALPESWEDLALFPALERIELPQSAIPDSGGLPEGYTVVLTGGDRP